MRPMNVSPWVLAIVAFAVAGCAAESDETEEETAQTADELSSSHLDRTDMKEMETPKGMPTPWPQPDSTGRFDEKGKCGPTAVANTLKLYGIDDVTPKEADKAGVHWWIGTRPRDIEQYLDREHAQLRCNIENPKDGRRFLHEQLDGGHSVMVLFSTKGFESHWVPIVGYRGTGSSEELIVMSWGRYFSIATNRFVDSWKRVYGMRNPSVVCEAKTTKLVVP
jgi:hypothetical protein